MENQKHINKTDITRILFYSVPILLYLIPGLIILKIEFVKSGFCFFTLIPIFLALFGFLFNKMKGTSKTIFSKSVYSSLEASTILLIIIFIYFTIATMVELSTGIELPGGEWRWGWQFIIFPIIFIVFEIGGLFSGVIMGLIRSRLQGKNIEQEHKIE